jgi:hypothetical protein
LKNWKILSVLLQIHSGSGAARIRNDFFRIRILEKIYVPSGFVSTTLLYARSFPKFQLILTAFASLCAGSGGWSGANSIERKNPVFFTYSCSMQYSDCLGADEVQLWASSLPHSSLSTFQETQVMEIQYTLGIFPYILYILLVLGSRHSLIILEATVLVLNLARLAFSRLNSGLKC